MLLKLLIENKNEVVTREKILQVVWGYNVYPTTRTIDNFILNFRKYFEKDRRNPRHFHSVRGMGYKYTDYLFAMPGMYNGVSNFLSGQFLHCHLLPGSIRYGCSQHIYFLLRQPALSLCSSSSKTFFLPAR